MSAADWTHQEQSVAKHAFETGKQRSIEALIVILREQSALLDTPESIWKFHDFLSSERFQYEGRSEFDTANMSARQVIAGSIRAIGSAGGGTPSDPRK